MRAPGRAAGGPYGPTASPCGEADGDADGGRDELRMPGSSGSLSTAGQAMIGTTASGVSIRKVNDWWKYSRMSVASWSW